MPNATPADEIAIPLPVVVEKKGTTKRRSEEATTTSTTNIMTMPSSSSCMICCEDDGRLLLPSAMIKLKSCGHESCKACMVKWIQKEEESAVVVDDDDDQTQAPPGVNSSVAPTCPFCRINIAELDTLEILGRPFQPKTLLNKNNNGEAQWQQQHDVSGQDDFEELDELTLDWLRERARPCPTCGIYIEKVEGGCDKMECLCGCRFCFACGSLNAQCDCTPATHHFWDNHQNESSNRNDTPLQAPRDEATGLVNLRLHIKERARRVRMERLRQERKRHYEEIEREKLLLEWDETKLNLSTCSGRWLFCSPSRIASIKVLGEMLCGHKVRIERWGRNKDPEGVERTQLDNLLSSGRWIFNNTPIEVVHQSLARLFYHQKRALRVRGKRERDRRRVARAPARGGIEIDLSTDWIFKKPSKLANYILERRILGSSVRRERARRRHEQVAEEKALFSSISSSGQSNNINQVVSSGRWLFVKKSTQRTQELLTRLVKHQCIAEERNFSQMIHDFLAECGDLDCPNCANHSSDSINHQETENAWNIRLLVLDDAEKSIEQVAIETDGF